MPFPIYKLKHIVGMQLLAWRCGFRKSLRGTCRKIEGTARCRFYPVAGSGSDGIGNLIAAIITEVVRNHIPRRGRDDQSDTYRQTDTSDHIPTRIYRECNIA